MSAALMKITDITVGRATHIVVLTFSAADALGAIAKATAAARQACITCLIMLCLLLFTRRKTTTSSPRGFLI